MHHAVTTPALTRANASAAARYEAKRNLPALERQPNPRSVAAVSCRYNAGKSTTSWWGALVKGHNEVMPDLSDEEMALLVAASDDDISLAWTMVYLGIRGNPPASRSWQPTAEDIEATFDSLARLVGLGLIEVGRIEQLDVGAPGSPVRHVAEDLTTTRLRVADAVASAHMAADWESSCWVVSTAAGDAVARNPR